MMHTNRLLARLSHRKVVFGVFIKSHDPSSIEILGRLGYDAVIIDTEHIGMDPQSLVHLIRTAELVGIEPVVRVRAADRYQILGVLDSGASCVQVPNVDDPSQAQLVREASFYQPKGSRGFATTSRAASYGMVDAEAYAKAVNEQTAVINQCESLKAVATLREQFELAPPDICFIGPMDMSQSVGRIGHPDSPEVRSAVRDVVKICREYDIPCGTTASSIEQLEVCKQLGMQFIALSSDVGMLIHRAKELLSIARSVL